MPKEREITDCHDCGVKPGELHIYGCDVERCPQCGGQMISHDCIYEFSGVDTTYMDETDPEIYENGPTKEMYAKWDAVWDHRRLPWTGEWPGVSECREFGWYCKNVGDKWHVPCSPDDPEGSEDLNRLSHARWDADLGRFVKRKD